MRERYRRKWTDDTAAPIAAHLAVCVLVCLILASGIAKLLEPRRVENTGLAAYFPPRAAVVPEYTRTGPAPEPPIVVTVEEPEPPPAPTTAMAAVLVEARRSRYEQPPDSPGKTARAARTRTANAKAPRREERRTIRRAGKNSEGREPAREFARADAAARVSASPFPGYATVR